VFALASYNRQAKDETLLKTAVRIQSRAITRAGELIEQIEPSKGGYSSLFDARVPPPTLASPASRRREMRG